MRAGAVGFPRAVSDVGFCGRVGKGCGGLNVGGKNGEVLGGGVNLKVAAGGGAGDVCLSAEVSGGWLVSLGMSGWWGVGSGGEWVFLDLV